MTSVIVTRENCVLVSFIILKREFHCLLKLEKILEKFEQRKKNFLAVYYKYIDSSGHPIGPFSIFEKRELEKLNLFLMNFLLHFRENYKSEFNDTVILLTADHGFNEFLDDNSLSKEGNQEHFLTISQEDMQQEFTSDFSVIVNNRSIFLKKKAFSGNISDLYNRFFNVWGLDTDDIVILETKKYPELFGDNETRRKAGDYFVTFLKDHQVIRKAFIKSGLIFKGQHGGWGAEELFVPFWIIPLKDILNDGF